MQVDRSAVLVDLHSDYVAFRLDAAQSKATHAKLRRTRHSFGLFCVSTGFGPSGTLSRL
jgi:hypothetical protein